MNCGDKTLPLPHNLYYYCSIKISSLVEIFSCKKKNKLCRQGGYLAYETYYTRRIDYVQHENK